MKFPVRISSLAYVPGYIFFVQDATLFARPFDETRLEFSGEPIRIVDGIPVMGPGRAPFSVSATGVLAYWPYPPGRRPSFIGSSGMAAPLPRWAHRPSTPASRSRPMPAGWRFRAPARTAAQTYGFAISSNGQEHQLTFDGAAFTPQWSPDGARIVFTGPGENPPPKLFIKNVADAGAASQVGVSKVAELCVELERRWPLDRQRPHRSGQSQRSLGPPPARRHRRAPVRSTPRSTSLTERSRPTIAGSPTTPTHPGMTRCGSRASLPETIRRQVSVGGGTSPEWGEGSKEILYLSDDNR